MDSSMTSKRHSNTDKMLFRDLRPSANPDFALTRSQQVKGQQSVEFGDQAVDNSRRVRLKSLEDLTFTPEVKIFLSLSSRDRW
jgi:hypothetical protein